MALRAEPHAAVAGRASRGREAGRQSAYRGRGDPGPLRHSLGWERPDEGGQRVESLDAPGQPAEVRPPLGEDDVQQGREQQGVGARPDGEMLVGRRGSLRAARVDDDHAAAPGPDGGEAPPNVGRAHQAAVGDQGIRAEDEEEVGPVDVRHRNQREVSEHA